MSSYTILAVDDESDILELLRYNLKKHGYKVIAAASAEEAQQVMKRERPDAIILDLMLPGMSGREFCVRLKSDIKTTQIPVMMLTAKGEEEDIVKGFELGADDYLTKPFSPRVLIARIKSLLRRSFERLDEHTQTIECEGLKIDPRRHEFYVDGEPVELTSTEFKILYLLMSKAGWVFGRQKIVDEVHGVDYPVTDRSIDVQVVGLRRKLGRYGALIETVRGVGYRFKDAALFEREPVTLKSVIS
jgi:two-component system phosphate regulon response regulator PhoB